MNIMDAPTNKRPIDYDLSVGTLTVKRSAVSRDTIAYAGSATQALVNPEQPPRITSGRTTFGVAILSDHGTIDERFTALVTAVDTYTIHGDELRLFIHYRKLDDSIGTHPSVTVPICPAHVLKHGDILILYYEGDVDYVMDLFDRGGRQFTYGTMSYHVHRYDGVSRKLSSAADAQTIIAGVIVTAGRQMLPGDDLDVLKKFFIEHILHIEL